MELHKGLLHLTSQYSVTKYMLYLGNYKNIWLICKLNITMLICQKKRNGLNKTPYFHGPCNNSSSFHISRTPTCNYILWLIIFAVVFYLCNNVKWIYWVTQKLPQICTVILRFRIGKVPWFAVYICGKFLVTQCILTKYPWTAYLSGKNSVMFAIKGQ